MLGPVAGDLHAPADPDLVVFLHVVEERRRRGYARGPAGEAAMQADRQHLRRRLAFRIEYVERVLQIREELTAAVETLRRCKAHIVGVERIGHDENRLFPDQFPIRQVIAVGIRVIEKAAVFRNKAPGILTGAPGVPPQRCGAGDTADRLDREADMATFGTFVYTVIIDPAPAMAGDLVAESGHGRHGLRIARHRHAHRKNRQRQLPLFEQAQQPPKAGSAAVLIERLHAHVACADEGLRTDDLRQECLRGRVAVQHAVLRALLIIEHELQRYAGPARPARMRRIAPVSDQIARIAGIERVGPNHAVTPRTRAKSMLSSSSSSLSLRSMASKCRSMRSAALRASPPAIRSISSLCSALAQGTLPGLSYSAMISEQRETSSVR